MVRRRRLNFCQAPLPLEGKGPGDGVRGSGSLVRLHQIAAPGRVKVNHQPGFALAKRGAGAADIEHERGAVDADGGDCSDVSSLDSMLALGESLS